tara:strand:+ start:1169 stop:1357 length:189 start_codon:yes stop_codon:yes gene_type:complete
MCKYDVMCEESDLPEGYTPVDFVPQQDVEELCYCYECKYDVMCGPDDLAEGQDGPIVFVPEM